MDPYNPYGRGSGHIPEQVHNMAYTEMPQAAQQPLWMDQNAQWLAGPPEIANPLYSVPAPGAADRFSQGSIPALGLMGPVQKRGMWQQWTQAQDDLLLTLKIEGKTHPEISLAIWQNFKVWRTHNVVAKRLAKLQNAVLSRADVEKCLENVLEAALSMINDEFSSQTGRQILPNAGDTQKAKRFLTGFYQRQLVLAERSAGEASGSEQIEDQDLGLDHLDGDFSFSGGPSLM